MVSLIKKYRYSFLLFLSILLAAILRFLWLDRIPGGISGDELTYFLTAKIAYITGSDFSGLWRPFSVFLFHYPSGILPQSELPYFITPYIWFPLPFSVLLSHIIPAFISIGIVIFVYLVTKELLSNQTAVIAAFLAAINPWFIFIGRTAYEANYAVFFFLVAMWILLVTKRWKILWSIPFLFLAFYSYIATKLIFLPFVIILLLYLYLIKHKKKFLLQYILVFASSLVLVLFFFFSLHANPHSSRLGEILTPNEPMITQQVDQLRKVTMANPFVSIFENKITIFIGMLVGKFFQTISFSYLFTTGDQFFSLWRGLFYSVDAVFLFTGIVALGKTKRHVLFLLSLLILLSVVPQLVHKVDTGNFTPHITLLFPFLIMVIASGIAGVIEGASRLRIKYVLYSIIFSVYIFSVGNFINTYFYVYPLQEPFDFSVRVLSRYIDLSAKTHKDIVIYSPTVNDDFKKFIFYTNGYNQKTKDMITSALQSNAPSISHITFRQCNRTVKVAETTSIIIYSSICGKLMNQPRSLTLPRLVDGGVIYSIYHDEICKNIQLNHYPQHITMQDFNVEKLSQQQFCKKLITDL